MKTARFVSVATLVFLAFASRAGADPAVNPYIQTDGDGVPLSVSNRQTQTSDDSNANPQQQDKNKDWLMRGYEQAKQNRSGSDSSSDDDNNLYHQLSSDRDLARLAGLPTTDDSDDASKAFRTGATPAQQGAVSLRREETPANAPTFSHDSFLKPFIMPLNASANSGAQSFYTPMPFALTLASPLAGVSTQAPVHRPDQSLSSSDLETPGMVAAENDPLANSSDLSIDALPGESPADARAHQDDYSKLELSLPMNSTELHKQQASALTPSGPNKTNRTDAATAANAAKPPPPPNTDSDPLPVSQAVPIGPHQPIANPFDILNR